MISTKIKHIESGEILDSRGNPTVNTTLVLECGIFATASVPSGASKGANEALELRDGNKERYGGMGVLKACSNVNVKIKSALLGVDASDQRAVDRAMIELDGTEDKSKLGANAILSVSMAASRAVSKAMSLSLHEYLKKYFGFKDAFQMPTPIMNLINGGAHASTNVGIQEFQIIPHGISMVSEKIQAGSEIFHSIGYTLKDQGLDYDVGAEGGYAPHVESIDFLFETMLRAIESCGFDIKKDISLGIDAAANSFYEKDKYTISPPDRTMSSEELKNLYLDWIEKYNLISIEDPFSEESWNDWSFLLKDVKEKNTMIIGDDLTVTNIKRIEKAISENAINSVLIKPNQIGTITETMDAISLAKSKGMKVIVSHRSGETNDDFITDLAVASCAEFLKAGAPSRGERVAKYNRLMEIEKEYAKK